MNTLTDDCQLLILKYLNLSDQLSLFEATNEDSTCRLNSNVRYTWERQLSFSFDMVLLRSNKKIESLDVVLSTISPKVQQINLKFCNFADLKRFAPYQFPNVISLEYRLDEYDAEFNGQKYLIKMTKLFPRLKNIKPHGVFNWILLTKFMYLTKLDLGACWTWFADTNKLALGIGELKLLEELIIKNELATEDLFTVYLRLPEHRALTFEHSPNLNDDDLRKMRAFLNKIALHENMLRTKLCTLKCCINYMSSDGELINEYLQQLIKASPELERLDLADFQFWKFESELWETVACCPSLKIVNLSKRHLREDFFDNSRLTMEAVLDKRSTPLTLNCHGTGKYAHLVPLYFKHPKLKLSFEPFKIIYFDFQLPGVPYICLTWSFTEIGLANVK